MSKKDEAQGAADDIIAAAQKKADEILAAAQKAADTEVAAAKDEAVSIKENAALAAVPKVVEQDKSKKHIISLRVCAIKKGYANHRIYEPGDKFLYRYWSHVQQGAELLPVKEEKALGGWMVTADDARFTKSKEELQDFRTAESDGSDVTLAAETSGDLNVL